MSVKKLFDLAGRVAIVTGGSRGLGLQMAEALGEMGATVVLTARKQDELDAAVAHLAKQGVRASAKACDLGRREAIVPVADAILAEHGKVDILINNAGATWSEPAEDHSLEGWDKLVGLNLTGTFILTQRIAKRAMIPAKYGRIVNVASVNGVLANDPRLVPTAAYVATKHGLVGLTRQLAAEWGRHGITVNAICPGFFPSKMTKNLLGRGQQMIVDATPTGRLGNDEDLKGATVLLASDAGAHITGQALVVDGGAAII